MVATDTRAAPARREGNKKATAIECAAWAKAGGRSRHRCGDQLYLQVVGAAASWVLRFRLGGKAREMGLGPYCAEGRRGLTLARAREAAVKALVLARDGIDPIAVRNAEIATRIAEAEKAAARPGPTFRAVAEAHIAAHEAGWRNLKHAKQWTATLAKYAFPKIGSLPVADVTTDHVLAVLQPIWRLKPETASRVRGRIEAILDAAEARGLRPEGKKNPAAWKGKLSTLLPPKGKVRPVVHHPALDWRDLPQFMTEASERRGVTWLAIRFAILTAARSGEVRGARWREIDLARRTWTIPAGRMKARREHRVPLSDAAVAILAERRGDEVPNPDKIVFPAPHLGALSDMAMTQALRRTSWRDGAGETITLHGFRSSFRDWAGETTSYPSDLCEAALAHTIGDKTQIAYQRGDLFEKRKRLMADWSAYCTAPPATPKVVPLARPA
jgi:integrase